MATRKSTEQVAGLTASCVWILHIAGVLAIILGIIAAFREDFQGAGVCLAAAALSHGLLLNALIRK